MNLALCIHNHQPVGNMDSILEEAYVHAYMPLFSVLKEFEDIKINIHFSGYLFTWLYRTKPEYVKLLKELKRRGQLEIVSGGMYEPVLSLIPEGDAIEQIQMHMDFMEKVFGGKPSGIWLAERVYEPHMPKILNKTGALYTLVDDNHFKAVGKKEDELYGYYVTEFEGYKLLIFPGLEFLRYAIPFKQISIIDEYLRGIAEKGGDLAVFGDDGEKFGLWPGTYHSVYEERWLREFFRYLDANKEWLKTVTFSEYIEGHPPQGLIYLECDSYREMGEWCLPARLIKHYNACLTSLNVESKDFIKGGYFKYFLVKYPESNDMHKRMFELSKRVKRNENAKKLLFMAQCNDSYWHGVFGGLYLPHLRASVYNNLIEAENRIESKRPFIEGSMSDVNHDGWDEAILNNKLLKAYFSLKEGGTLYELDYKPSCTNIMATLTRRYEGYHDKIKIAQSQSSGIADGTKTIHDMVLAKEEGLEQYLYYDWYRRASLIDHMMAQDASFESFYKGVYVEPGDFVKEPYTSSIKKQKKSVTLSLTRDGYFWKGDKGIPCSIKKDITLQEEQNLLMVDYLINGSISEPCFIGIEFNFSLLGSGGERYLEIEDKRYPLTIKEILKPSQTLIIFDPYQHVKILLSWDQPHEIWTFPVEVVSLSENGFERNYQNTMVMPLWLVDLTQGSTHIKIKLQLEKI